MIPSLIILAVLVVAGALLYAHHRLTDKAEEQAPEAGKEGEKPDSEAARQTASDEEGCCGMHITCEKDSLLAAVSKDIEYYDDEELDSYRGRGPEDYADDEIEQFRDVLLTLLPQDIAGWGRSLQLRGIELPAPIKEELIMIVAEERQKRG